MPFKQCDEALSAGLFVVMADDGETAEGVFVAEPIAREGEFRGKARTQFLFPLVTEDGLQVWTVGSRIYRQLRDGWKNYYKKQVRIVRQGKKNDPHTKYKLEAKAPSQAFKGLLRKVKPKDIKEALEAAAGTAATGETDEIPV